MATSQPAGRVGQGQQRLCQPDAGRAAELAKELHLGAVELDVHGRPDLPAAALAVMGDGCRGDVLPLRNISVGYC